MSISVANRGTQSSGALRPMLPFYVGAAADVLIGIDLVLFGPAIAAWLLPGQEALLGVAAGTVLRVLGAVLVVFGIETAWLARSKGALRRFLPAVVAANWVWVAASAVILVVDAAFFSAAGIAAVALVALAVAALAVLQSRAMKAAE